jgi:hypothetical protein
VNGLKNLIKARRGTASIYAIVLMVIVTFAFGILFFNFVVSKVDFAKNTFSSQMTGLLLNSFSTNATCITVWLQNAGASLVEITGAYVNGLIGTLTTIVKIEPSSIGEVFLQGIFVKGSTYTIKLLSVFNTLITFEIPY